jgi:hypothetical protein
MARARAADQAVRDGSFSEVWPVPTTPLEEILAAAAQGDGLISEETLFATNVGLWRIGVFNHLVRLQSDFNIRHLGEFYDPHLPAARRVVLANVAGSVSKMLHQQGIGEANVVGGWYQRFCDALEADIDRLATLRREGLFDYDNLGRGLLIGDIAFTLLLGAFSTLAIAAVV